MTKLFGWWCARTTETTNQRRSDRHIQQNSNLHFCADRYTDTGGQGGRRDVGKTRARALEACTTQRGHGIKPSDSRGCSLELVRKPENKLPRTVGGTTTAYRKSQQTATIRTSGSSSGQLARAGVSHPSRWITCNWRRRAYSHSCSLLSFSEHVVSTSVRGGGDIMIPIPPTSRFLPTSRTAGAPSGTS